MHSIFKLSILAASISLIVSCGEKAEVKTTEQTEVAATKVPVGTPQTDIEKQAYGLGASFGAYLKRALDENEKVGVVIDRKMVMNGVLDTVDGTEKMTKEDIKKVMEELDALTRAKHAELAKKIKAEAIKAGKEYMAANAKKENVVTTESGLQYEIVKQGDGARPTATDIVKVHYKGTLINGEIFDSSYQRDEPAVFGVSQVIRGWTEGLQLMTVGSKYNFIIPSELAYGERASGKITPNSTLLFEVELLGIEPAAK